MQEYRITFARSGATFPCPADTYVLDAAEVHGLSPQFGCRQGICQTCPVRLAQGAVDQSEGIALTAEEQAGGLVMICVAYPRADCIFDA